MTEAGYRKKLQEYRRRMHRDSGIDGVTFEAYCWWMNKQLAEMQQEIEKIRRPGRISLSTRLKYLVTAILAQTPSGVKEARGAPSEI